MLFEHLLIFPADAVQLLPVYLDDVNFGFDNVLELLDELQVARYRL